MPHILHANLQLDWRGNLHAAGCFWLLRRPAPQEKKAGRKHPDLFLASLSLSTTPTPTLSRRDTHGLLEYTVRTTPDSDSTRLSPRAEAATRAFEYVSKERRKRSLADRSLQTSVSQSVITTLLPTEHMVPTHSDLLHERAMDSLHLVVSSGRARTSG